MLGATLDYLILRSLAHSQNRLSEEQLDARFREVSEASFAAEARKFDKVIARFAGHLPLAPDLRYLDMGCGTGELSIAIARASGGHVTGVDFLPRSVERAERNAQRLGMNEQVRFICQDLNRWTPPVDQRFDVLLSFDAFEHISQPQAFLAKMADFMTPDGMAVLAFGPLFHSPFGDHMWDFFRLQIPWRGLIFREEALLRVRRECFRPTDPAQRFADIAGGLNQLRYSEFLKAVAATGWHFEYLAVNTFFLPIIPLRWLSAFLIRHPRVGDYFAHNVYAVLRRQPASDAGT